ncbi:MAG: MFS transporter [Chloroflexi bacterium]|nr:MFS transporter [Chloroflexota bacterium]
MDNITPTIPARLTSRMRNVFAPRASLDAQNAWNLYGDIFWFGVLFAVWQSFLSVFTIRLGGSDTHVGLLAALPALAAIFASIPGSRLVEREKKPLSVLLRAGALHRVGFLAIGFAPFFFAGNRADVVIIVFGLASVASAIANVAFTTMFARAVQPADRPRVVSLRNVLLGIATTATALIGGHFLDLVTFPTNYQFLFAIAFLASMLSIYYLARIRFAAKSDAPEALAQESRGARGFIAMLRAHPSYIQFTLAAIVIHLALFFSIPLYSIYWVRTLHATEGWVGLITTVQIATTIFFFPIWGRWSARLGNRATIALSGMAIAGYPLFTVLAPSLEWLLLVAFWGGAMSPGISIALFNGLLEVTPEKNRASFIAAFNTLVNIAAFLAPMFSSSLTGFISVPILLLIGAALRFIGAAMVMRG